MPFYPIPSLYQASPADPTGTTSAVNVMAGLAGSITPKVTGRVVILVSGTVFNATAIADGAEVQISFGTGTAPINGAALTGTQVGGLQKYIASTALGKVPFALQALVTTMVPGTAYWLDLAFSNITAGTASLTDISITAFEI